MKEPTPWQRYRLTGRIAGERVDKWTSAKTFAHAWKRLKEWACKRYGLPDAPPSVILKDCMLEGPDSITGRRIKILPDYP